MVGRGAVLWCLRLFAVHGLCECCVYWTVNGVEDGPECTSLRTFFGQHILGSRYSASGLVLVAYSANLYHVQWHTPGTQLVLGYMNTTSKVHHTCQ